MVAQIDSAYLRMRPTKVLSRLASYLFFEGRPATTSGRFVNPLVFALLAAVGCFPPFRRVRKPIFILGMGRSGTTVMGVVLSMHRDVGFLNEPKAIWHAIVPYEDVIGSYSSNDARYRLAEIDATELVVRKARRFFGAYLAVIGSTRLVDKYPELIFRIPFVQAIFPDARFVVMVRNGWDTCHSIAAWSKHNGRNVKGQRHDWWGVDRRKWNLLVDQIVRPDPAWAGAISRLDRIGSEVDMAAVEWVVTMREALVQSARQPDCVKLVRYEDLTGQPEEVLRSIAEFCELNEDQKYLDYGKGILRPSTHRAPVDLSPAVKPLFLDTMTRLGYR